MGESRHAEASHDLASGQLTAGATKFGLVAVLASAISYLSKLPRCFPSSEDAGEPVLIDRGRPEHEQTFCVPDLHKSKSLGYIFFREGGMGPPRSREGQDGGLSERHQQAWGEVGAQVPRPGPMNDHLVCTQGTVRPQRFRPITHMGNKKVRRRARTTSFICTGPKAGCPQESQPIR